ncbi:MAG: phosphatidylglycerol lysyltransferase domain-containing protein, partial [Mycobacteriales bacterium]
MTSGRKVTTAPPRRDDEIERRWRPVSARVPRLMAVLVRLLGLLTIASVLLPEQRARIHFLAQAVGIPVLASATAAASATIFGVVLLVLAGGLRRRKRRAWRATVLVTLALVLSHLLRGLDVEDAAVSAGILIALIVTREQFYAVGDPTTRWWHAVATPLRILLIGLAAGMIAFAVRPELLLGKPSLWQELQQLLLGLVGVSGPLRFSSDRANDIVGATSIGFGAVFILVAVYLAFRCAAPRAALTPDDEERLRALLTAQGSRDSLGYFALRRDKSVVWSGSGKAAVLYRVVSGVALASGDPIGDPEAWPGAIDVFLDLARRHAWVPAVVGCSEQGATVYDRHGLDALELGDEAIVDSAAFSLQGRAMRGVRQAVNRTERAGYDVTIRRVRDIDPAELAGLARTASAWRGGDVERGFSMVLSRLGDPADGDCVVVEAVREGTVRGLLQFAPWGDDGLSLDLMRRDRSADNGVSELMIVRLLEAGPDLHVRRVSLNFAAFRSALERGERIGAGPVLRLWRHALRFASRWWQIESLYRFNLKFQPEWQPRFLSFPLSRDLPRIAFAALEAEAFFVRPRRLQR